MNICGEWQLVGVLIGAGEIRRSVEIRNRSHSFSSLFSLFRPPFSLPPSSLRHVRRQAPSWHQDAIRQAVSAAANSGDQQQRQWQNGSLGGSSALLTVSPSLSVCLSNPALRPSISLAADVRSYLTEKATHESAFLSASAAGSGREPHEIRRAREFVEEADNTLLDVRQRLQESFVGLQRFLAELAAQGDLHAPLLADAAVEEARAVLREVAPLVNSAEAVEAAVQRAFKVCVLGDSQLNEGHTNTQT